VVFRLFPSETRRQAAGCVAQTGIRGTMAELAQQLFS
jgi:hypothetical protein